MEPIVKKPFNATIQRIDKIVVAAENYLQTQKQLTLVVPADRLMFETSPLNRATYLRSPIERLSQLLLRVEFKTFNPDFKAKSAGVLGGGLGAAAFTLALFFEKVTSFELDYNLWEMSKKVASKLGTPHNKVIFNHCNVFKDVNIKGFDFLYFFEPVLDNYEKLGDLLKEASPGTIILSSIFVNMDHYPLVFPYSHFIRHQPFQSLLQLFDIHERNEMQ